MKKKLLALLLAAVAVVSCFAACGKSNVSDGNASDTNVSEENSVSASSQAEEKSPFFADFETTALDGKTYTQEAFTGNRLTMVNIWGTFCAPCIREMPDLEKLSKDYAGKGLAIVGIVGDTFDYLDKANDTAKIDLAKDIVKDTGVTYLNLLPSPTLNTAKLDYIRSFPTTYFLNEKGELLGEYIGSRSYDQWAEIIDSLLAE